MPGPDREARGPPRTTCNRAAACWSTPLVLPCTAIMNDALRNGNVTIRRRYADTIRIKPQKALLFRRVLHNRDAACVPHCTTGYSGDCSALWSRCARPAGWRSSASCAYVIGMPDSGNIDFGRSATRLRLETLVRLRWLALGWAKCCGGVRFFGSWLRTPARRVPDRHRRRPAVLNFWLERHYPVRHRASESAGVGASRLRHRPARLSAVS